MQQRLKVNSAVYQSLSTIVTKFIQKFRLKINTSQISSTESSVSSSAVYIVMQIVKELVTANFENLPILKVCFVSSKISSKSIVNYNFCKILLV